MQQAVRKSIFYVQLNVQTQLESTHDCNNALVDMQILGMTKARSDVFETDIVYDSITGNIEEDKKCFRSQKDQA